MELNGYTIFGGILVAGGWLMVLFGTGVDVSGYGMRTAVYNLQLGSIAQQICMLGYTFLIIGTLVSGFRWLKPHPYDVKAKQERSSKVTASELNASPLRDFAKAASSKGSKSSADTASAESVDQ